MTINTKKYVDIFCTISFTITKILIIKKVSKQINLIESSNLNYKKIEKNNI
jgi:hypothetical protein